MRGALLKVVVHSGLNRAQRVLDPGFNNASLDTLGGSGVGTTAVTGGALVIASTTSTYTLLPTTIPALHEPGSYSVTYTVGSYVSGGIGIAGSASSDLSSPTDGTARSANGTYTETLVLSGAGYIGLRGRSGTVNSMSIDDLTITRVG